MRVRSRGRDGGVRAGRPSVPSQDLFLVEHRIAIDLGDEVADAPRVVAGLGGGDVEERIALVHI
jgi:hypothetical protein